MDSVEQHDTSSESRSNNNMGRRREDADDPPSKDVPSAAHQQTSPIIGAASGRSQGNPPSQDLLMPVENTGPFAATITGAPLPRFLVKRWPSTLMQLIGEADGDSWESVEQRIQSHPEEIMIAGENGGMNALHAACIRYPPLPVVEAMTRTKPEAVEKQNFSGETPLLLAMHCASEEVQVALIRAAPKAAAIPDQYGDTPLHFAAKSGSTLRIMEPLLEAAPQCMSMRNRRGATPFWFLPRSFLDLEDVSHLLIDADENGDRLCDWNHLALFLRYAYKDSRVTGDVLESVRGFVVDDSRTTTPQHAMLRAWVTKQYEWVVHAAASAPSCPRETLACLCRLFPQKALERDDDGYTPLLRAVQAPEIPDPEEWDENEDGFREHVDAVEGELRNADDDVREEDTSLRNGDREFLENQIHKQAAAATDAETPVDILLEWSQRSAMIPDGEGRLPLAHALVSGKSARVVRRLIAACPRLMAERDAKSGLLMFQLAAMHSPDVETVYNIVRCLPESIESVRQQGVDPRDDDDEFHHLDKKPRAI